MTKSIKRATMKSIAIFNSDPRLDLVVKSMAKQIPSHTGS